jgi:TRAP-type mannitol/chloroaromatic compound transport system permease small subunit
MHVVNKLIQIIDSITEAIGKITSFLLLGIMATVIYEVLMRYVFKSPTTWTSEMSQFLFGALASLGGAYTLLYNGHVRMDAFYSRFSAKGKIIIDLATSLFFLMFLIVLIYKGSQFALRAIALLERSDSAWGPLLWPTKILIPIAGLLMLLQGATKYIRSIRSLTEKEKSDGC